MENKTQTLMQIIICAYAQHRAWCEDDTARIRAARAAVEIRVRKVNDKWDTWIAGLGAEGECFPSTACSASAKAESLEASLLTLASLLAGETKEQFDALKLLHSIAEASK